MLGEGYGVLRNRPVRYSNTRTVNTFSYIPHPQPMISHISSDEICPFLSDKYFHDLLLFFNIIQFISDQLHATLKNLQKNSRKKSSILLTNLFPIKI